MNHPHSSYLDEYSTIIGQVEIGEEDSSQYRNSIRETSRLVMDRAQSASVAAVIILCLGATTTAGAVAMSVAQYAQYSIGYIGCSNTEDAVGGYYLVSTADLFWKVYDTAGGTLDRWANPNNGFVTNFWANFQQELQKYGQPLKVWIQICENPETAILTFSMVQETITMLRQYVPSAQYYISPLNSFSPSNLCQITGPNGVQDATNLANEAVSSGLALQGPILGPLTSSQTLPPSNCHATTAGMMLLGSQLSGFFDASTASSISTTSTTASSISTTSTSTSTTSATSTSAPGTTASSTSVTSIGATNTTTSSAPVPEFQFAPLVFLAALGLILAAGRRKRRVG